MTISRRNAKSVQYIEQIWHLFVQYTEQMKEGMDAQQRESLSVRGGFRGVRSGSAELHLVDGKWLAGVIELDAR